MNPTDEQRQVIEGTGHTLVEAGAGSGKTSTLVQKIVHLLRDGGCDLHEIAAITFTNAAAADFKRKLRAELRKIAVEQAAANDEAGAQRWRALVHEVDRARIGTIHSFCGSILREFGLRVGLDPRFRVLDEGESALLRAEAARDTLRAALEDDDENAVTLCESHGVNGAERLVARLMRKGGALDAVAGTWYAAGDPLTLLREAHARGRAEWELPEGEAEWNEALDPEAVRVAGAALALARTALRKMEERLAAEGALDFDALVDRTLAVLRERADVRGALRRRLRWLFIDEFQDTDASQLAIAELIAGIGEGAVDGVPVADGPKLCIVGDPKQSIYRFRGADVTVWQRAVKRFAELGVTPIPLAVNFRSLAPILGYVNATFDGLIGAGREAVRRAGQEVPFASLAAHRRTSPAERCVELLGSATPVPDKAEERRRHEARCIATRLAELRDESRQPDGAYEVDWRHMAILFRTREPMARAEEELRALGIPCYVAGGSGFFARREVRDVRLLLRALADPSDELAWLGLYRSPFVGVSDATLLRFRATVPGAPLSALVTPGAASRLPDVRTEDVDALARAEGWIGPLRALRDRVPTAELIEMGLDRSGYGAQLLVQTGGRLALANLRKLARLADGRPGETLGEFLAWIDEREDGEARDGDAALYTAGENVVTLTTVHGAKGLEWDVVVLADVAQRDILSSNKAPDVHLDPAIGVGLKLADADGNKPGLWTLLDARDRLLGRAEEKRLWYVATTRAKDRLLVCAGGADVHEAAGVADADADAKQVPQWLLRALAPGEDGAFAYEYDGATWHAHESLVPAAEPTPRVRREIPSLEDALAAAASATGLPRGLEAQLRPVVAAPLLPRRSATELMAFAGDAKAWRQRYGGAALFRSSREISARIIGDVVHEALEQAREAQDLLEHLESELVSRSGEPVTSPALQRALAYARDLVECAREHPDVVRLAEAGGEHELPFTWFARSATGVHHVRGAMDLVAVVDGVPEILDFKSSAITAGGESAGAAPYALQRDTYAVALHQVLGVAPSRFTFLFPATGGTHVDPLGAEALVRGEAEVVRLLDGLAETAFRGGVQGNGVQK